MEEKQMELLEHLSEMVFGKKFSINRFGAEKGAY
jgi:hypothetical protein